MNRSPLTPEEIVLQFGIAEMLELLEDLDFESTPQTAILFKQTLKEIGSLEETLEQFAHPRPLRQVA